MLLFLLCTVLHFDLNQTIIVSDEAGGKTSENVIAHNLAKEVVEKWDDSLEKPLSYFDYIYYHKFDAPRSDKVVKKAKLHLLSSFPDFLEKIGHARSCEVRERYLSYCAKATEMDGLIVPSFYRLVDVLRKSDTIVLRTFGGDLQAAIDEIESKTPIRFSHRGKFLGHTLHLDDGRVLDSACDIVHLFRTGHCAIQDDYHYWNAHNEIGPYGKLFPYDGNSLFFDDHVNIGPNAFNVVAPVDAKTGLPLDTKSLVDSRMIMKANILEALMDDSYYEKSHQRHRVLQATRQVPHWLVQFLGRNQ